MCQIWVFWAIVHRYSGLHSGSGRLHTYGSWIRLSCKYVYFFSCFAVSWALCCLFFSKLSHGGWKHFPLFTDWAMDHVLSTADSYIFTPYVYPASWPADGALRQILSLWVVTTLGAELIYLGFGALSFYYVFDHKLMKHPHFIKVSWLMDWTLQSHL